MSENNAFNQYLEEHTKAVSAFAEKNNIDRIVTLICDVLLSGGTLYAFGNGGSAADASHFVGELIGRFEIANRVPYRAVCLNCDMSSITAIANDYSYTEIFARQVQSLVKAGDVVIALSTSGNSLNVINAILTAKRQGALVIGFTGANDHNELRLYTDCDVVAPSTRTCIIQEIHQVALHYIAAEIEKVLK